MSKDDQCYAGSAPGPVYGGCHGDGERPVFTGLCDIVEDAIALYVADNRLLRPPTSARTLANRRQDVT